MFCPKCGSEAEGRFCQNCGTELGGKRLPIHKKNPALAVVIGCVVFVSVYYLLTNVIGIYATPAILGGTPGVTVSRAEFERIRDGMTYEQVCDIIGGRGEVMSEVGSRGDAFHTIIYMWPGNGVIGANANFTFQGGKLVGKAQAGLK